MSEVIPGRRDVEVEVAEALRVAHRYLEDPRGFIPLDHRIGENDDGCTFCHALAALEGRVAPLERGDY